METNLRILLVEDDENFRSRVESSLSVYNQVEGAGSIAQARELIQEKPFDLIILDKTLPDGDGTSIISEIRLEQPEVVIIILTADRNYGAVKKYMDMGADDYVAKSEITICDLLVRIPVALRHAANDRKISRIIEVTQKALKHEIVGNAPSTAKLREDIQTVRGSPSNVLITGESGTGKELIARRLNAIDRPGIRPLVTINCSAIPENLVESELFGHKKGAFTNAHEDKKGLFELAHNGDLFLDEIGDLPIAAQAKLLRVLQEGEVRRVGAEKAFPVIVRIIAATNKPLELLIKKGHFREDLYYRLNVIRFKTEPLRNRLEDVSDLAKCFVFQIGGVKASIADEAIALLQGYQWPGNIRELRNCIERAYNFARNRKNQKIEARDILIDGESTTTPLQTGLLRLQIPTDLSGLTPNNFEKFMFEAEKQYLKQALELCQGDSLKAAIKLGLARSTIFKKMKDLKISRPNIEEASMSI